MRCSPDPRPGGEWNRGFSVSAASLAEMYSRGWRESRPKRASSFSGVLTQRMFPSSRHSSPRLRVTMERAWGKGTSRSSREMVPDRSGSTTRFRSASWARLWRTSRTGASFTERDTGSAASTQRTGFRRQNRQANRKLFMAIPPLQTALVRHIPGRHCGRP